MVLYNNVNKMDENTPLNMNIEEEMEMDIREVKTWSKDLKLMPMFTVREIEIHREKSGKLPGVSIIKTLDRGKNCRASMKKENRYVEVSLCRSTGAVLSGRCTCPAGASGYCNHVMALLFELADYSLNLLQCLPEEVACTSKNRSWGIPSKNIHNKDPIMNLSVKHKGECTLYDPRLKKSRLEIRERTLELQEGLAQSNRHNGFAHCIDTSVQKTNSTKYGDFIVGSTLSHQLLPLEMHLSVISNIQKEDRNNSIHHLPVSLPLTYIGLDSKYIPNWGSLTYRHIMFLEIIRIEESDCPNIEQETVMQSQCDKWFEMRANRITSSRAHKVLQRKRNFDTLSAELLKPKSDSVLPQSVKDALNHSKTCEPVAREKYIQHLKYTLKHDIAVRETGIVLQPYLFWLGASPDGLVQDTSESNYIGLIEIKCPKSKQNSTPQEMLSDKHFYMHMTENGPQLKINHNNGYYTQIQMAMGLSCVKFCDFIVFSFKGLIISRIVFDEDYFEKLSG